MAKHARKINQALKARQEAFASATNNDTYLRANGLFLHKPGSQNRRKGYGLARHGGRRR